MEYDIQNLVEGILLALQNLYHSPFVLVLKVLMGIYLVILSINIVLLLILRDVPAHLRVGLKGMDIPAVSKSKMQKSWEQIKARLKTGNSSQYKVAIIEADALCDQILGGIGYKGANMTEKLEQVGAGHLDDHLEALQGVHNLRNKIVHEADFEIDEKMAKAVLGVYENFLKYLEYLD